MDIKQCPNCQKQFDQDKRVSKQLPCGCVSCLKCLKIVFKLTKKIECANHQIAFNINPNELQDYAIQEQVQQKLLHPQVKFVVQEQIANYFKQLQDQYAQKLNHNSEIIKVIQDSSLFMKYIQQLAIKEIHKSLIEQFSISNERIKNLLQRLLEFQVANEVCQQQQTLILGQQDPQISQNPQQYQFQQILSEIEELKANQSQWMDVQILRVNVQRCMFNLFIYLSENSGGQLLSDKKVELLVQKYFKQFKVVRGLSQVSSQLFHKKGSFKSQGKQQLVSQESWRIDQQQQSQVIDKKQVQDIVQDQQFPIQKKLSLQERQVIDARVSFQQIEQKLINLQNDFRFINPIKKAIQEQAIIIEPMPLKIIAFDSLLQFLNQIKNENVSVQALQFSLLNKSELIEQSQILNQLSTVTDQQICSQLYQIIQLSKNQPKIQQVATNALTILNYMNFDFTNLDLSNLDLTNSNLSDTTFTSCNFSNSNLTQANLRNTKFINCDLSNANLTSIITEYPHIYTGHTSYVSSVVIFSDSQFIVSGSHDNMVRLWDVKTTTSKAMSDHTSAVTAVAISSDSEFIVSGSLDCTIILWDVKTGTCKTMSGHQSSVNAVAISRDSQFIVSGSNDNTLRLWDVKTNTSKAMSDHTSYVYAVAISSDSQFIVSGSYDDTVRLWNAKTQQCIKVLKGHTKCVNAVSISNDQQFIVSGSDDKTIRLWSTKSQQCIKVLKGHTSWVLSVIFSVDSRYIISGSKDKTIRI